MAGAREFSFLQNIQIGSRAHLSSCQWVHVVLSRSQIMRFTTHCHLIMKLKMSAVKHPLPCMSSWHVIIIIIGTTAPFEPRSSSEASASCPYPLHHSSNFSPPTSWHLPSHHLPFSVSACPSVFFLLPLQPELFM